MKNEPQNEQKKAQSDIVKNIDTKKDKLLINKHVIQSYILTTAKYDFTVYEKRILYRIVEASQAHIEGKKLSHNFEVNLDLFSNAHFAVPLRYFLNGETDKNHKRIKDALEGLNNKSFTYEDDEIWKIIRIIEKPKINKYDELVTFEVQPEVFQVCLNFSKGFRKFELKTVMSFKSVYSMRFYELLAGQKKPMLYNIDTLKEMFQVTDKYKKNNDFIRFVIKPAQKELNKNSPYSFVFAPKKTGRKITGLLITPRFIKENQDPDLATKELSKQVDITWSITKEFRDYLIHNYSFTKQEIKNNIKVLQKAEEYLQAGLFDVLSENRTKAQDKKNPKGWIVGVLKKQIQEILLDHELTKAGQM